MGVGLPASGLDKHFPGTGKLFHGGRVVGTHPASSAASSMIQNQGPVRIWRGSQNGQGTNPPKVTPAISAARRNQAGSRRALALKLCTR